LAKEKARDLAHQKRMEEARADEGARAKAVERISKEQKEYMLRVRAAEADTEARAKARKKAREKAKNDAKPKAQDNGEPGTLTPHDENTQLGRSIPQSNRSVKAGRGMERLSGRMYP